MGNLPGAVLPGGFGVGEGAGAGGFVLFTGGLGVGNGKGKGFGDGAGAGCVEGFPGQNIGIMVDNQGISIVKFNNPGILKGSLNPSIEISFAPVGPPISIRSF